MSVIEHWIAYDVKREIGPTILREKWRADLFRADERNRVDGPFVPAEQLAGAVEQIAELERLLHQANTEREDWKRWCLAHEAEVGRLRQQLEGAVGDLRAALNELGVPGPDYPAPVANAVDHIKAALAHLGGRS
jgi:hypothetical protein